MAASKSLGTSPSLNNSVIIGSTSYNSTVASPAYVDNGYWSNSFTLNSTVPSVYVDYNNYQILNYMSKKYLDDRLKLQLDLAGFKKEEISVKYLPENENCGSQPYIEIIASSPNHFRKLEGNTEYKYSIKEILSSDREYDFDKISVVFEDGVLTIEIPFAENSKLKTVTIK